MLTPKQCIQLKKLFNNTSSYFLLAIGLLFSIVGNAQIKAPTPPMPQPATMPRHDQMNNMPAPNQYGQVKMGTTADDIMRQVNRNNPQYGYGNDPANNRRANEAWIKAQMANDPAYNPALRNGVSNYSSTDKQQRELLRDLQDIVNMDNYRAAIRGTLNEDFNSPKFAIKTKSYTDALRILKNMLSGKQKLSLADAYFVMENAYGEAYLTKKEFDNTIKQSTDFIRIWMQQNNLNIKDNAAINFAVQQFMGWKQQISIPKSNANDRNTIELENITHDPFSYDFIDNGGDKDHRNFFMTKCLATGTGQCNSLPGVYVTLVEALGGKAYIAIAPQHSLVKYPDGKGNIRNYEPTSCWDITSEWYYDNMFISKQAAKNKVYLNPWSGKQIVADIILQLAFGYFRKFGGADGKFINDCINTAKPYFPQNNNLMVYFNLSNLYGYRLMQAMRKNGINQIPDIGKSPEAQKALQVWQENERVIEQLGYQDMPKNMYEEMMKYHEFRGRVQQGNNFNGKEKRSLFIKLSSSQNK